MVGVVDEVDEVVDVGVAVAGRLEELLLVSKQNPEGGQDEVL